MRIALFPPCGDSDLGCETVADEADPAGDGDGGAGGQKIVLGIELDPPAETELTPDHGGGLVLHIVTCVEDPESRGEREVGIADGGHPVGDPDQIVVEKEGKRADRGLHPGAPDDLELRREVDGLDSPKRTGAPAPIVEESVSPTDASGMTTR